MKKALLSLCCLLQAIYCLLGQGNSHNIIEASATDSTTQKKYASQKVINQSPFKIINLGYEYHGEHDLVVDPAANGYQNEYQVKQVAGMRFNLHLPLINTPKTILTIRASYQGSNYDIAGKANGAINPALSKLDADGLQTGGIILTLFKPLNEKHVIIAQLETLLAGSYASWNDISTEGLTIGGSAFFTWKLNERTLIGPGVGRTYRVGRPVIFPLLYWYQTFNDKWGMELALPARGYLRRNFDSRSLMMLGYEIEGNQHEVNVNGTGMYLQRGEIKPRLQYERQLIKSVWLSAQAGIRMNGRFDFVNTYDTKEEANTIYRMIPANPFYFNVSLNLVSL
jgi:hypothetical protein